MFNRRIALAALVLALVTVFAAPSMQAGANLANVNRVTFNRAVALPGVILLPGSYTFEAGALGMSPNVVRVTSPDYQKRASSGLLSALRVRQTWRPTRWWHLARRPSANRPQSERGTDWFPVGPRVSLPISPGCEGRPRDALRTRRVRSGAVCGPQFPNPTSSRENPRISS